MFNQVINLNNTAYPFEVITDDDLNNINISYETMEDYVYGYYDSYGEISINEIYLDDTKCIEDTIRHELIHFITDKYFGFPYYEDNNDVFKSLLYWFTPNEAKLMYGKDSTFKQSAIYEDVMNMKTFNEVLECITWYIAMMEYESSLI